MRTRTAIALAVPLLMAALRYIEIFEKRRNR